jgi:hypothetical protein
MSKLQPEISTDFAWTADELSAYHEQYRRVARADSLLAKAAINAIALEDSNGRPLLDQFDSGILFGVGGVPRGAGIILPTLRETATITLSDNTHQNVESTREIMRQITHNNSKQAHWGLHEKDMETHDERWERAIGKAALIAKFEVIDLREVNESLADVSGMEYVTDSMLEDREDYVATMRNFTTSAREMIYMAYMVGSKRI